MAVELLWWAGCPSHPAVAEQLRGLGVPFAELEIVSEEDAARERFPGSPTVRVDGVDLFPSDEPPSLTCRIYVLGDGRFSPVPDVDELRAALLRAGCELTST
ncbi:hypothetical protein OJ997_29080 [Solirubrobacter phytolaccae]|uniref:Thioredoxin family protein n=1 Tax=Solirubrobacter phytolaccae TaxID=1404360 RepID=A0A9X3NDF9_9ACTN|nr:hypothetical protein [Solirubrobacter phytolaccae]MDA0184393.1 hypothetical protein [Solirubrobacter phytolaccae]